MRVICGPSLLSLGLSFCGLSCSGTGGLSDSTNKAATDETQTCSASTEQILTNGVFSREQPTGINNHFIAAALAENAYPYSFPGFTLEETMAGLPPEKNALYRSKFRERWSKLGATSIDFIEARSNDRLVEGNAIVIGTTKDVYLVFRGTSYVAQFLRELRQVDVPYQVSGKTVQLWEAVTVSTDEIYSRVETSVRTALSKTASPTDARLWLMGHSIGGAQANLSGLKLLDKIPGLKIAGVYTFGSNRSGFDCGPGETCWSRLYDQKLGAVTHRWVNDMDVAPTLPFKIKDHQNWGFVPLANRPMYRLIGDSCGAFSGEMAKVCPEALKKNGGCDTKLVDHMPAYYTRKLARCGLAAKPLSFAPEVSGKPLPTVTWDACTRKALLNGMLGVP